MATELFSVLGMQTGWRSQHGDGYQVLAELDGVSIWCWAETVKEVERDFHRACRRTLLRRYFKFLAPPPTEIVRGSIEGNERARMLGEPRETAEAFSAHDVMSDADLTRIHELAKTCGKDRT